MILHYTFVKEFVTDVVKELNISSLFRKLNGIACHSVAIIKSFCSSFTRVVGQSNVNF